MGIGAILAGGESGKEEGILHLSLKKKTFYENLVIPLLENCLAIKWALNTNITN